MNNKKYIPEENEPNMIEFWLNEGIYKFNPDTDKPLFKIDTPPPTVSGRMHIGHASSYTQTDYIARFKRMKGFEVFYPFGTDDNGLATEKLVQKEKGVNLKKIDRKEAVKIVLDHLKEIRPAFINDWKNIGISCDFDLSYSTIDDYSRKISQKSFLDLHKKGLIVRREGPVMWDRVFQTAIAQAELEDLKRKSTLNYIKAKIKDSEKTYMIYATTRPELCFAAVGMSVEDQGNYVKLKVNDEYWICSKNTYNEKFKDFNFEVVEELKGQDIIGEKVTIPLSNITVEVSHDIAIDANFGTGIAYFCTYGGLEDIEWVARHEAEPIQLLDKSGRLNEKGGKYKGMLADEARKEIIKEMESSDHIIKKETIDQTVNVYERSNTEVEFIVSNQWYVKYLDKKEYFFEQSQKFNWYPEHMKHRLENWIKGLNWDWGFSRQRHFGIPIPVWYDKEGNMYLPDEDQLPVDPTVDRPNSAPKDIELIPETDVFDTWFTSASSPFLSINLLKDHKVYNKLFPMDLRPQAHDIINFWLFYTMAKTNLLYEENPFKDVVVSGFVVDQHGRKMAKSKGNVILPNEVIEKYSRDALRYWISTTSLGDDIRYSDKEMVRGKKLINKIWNASKFASMNLENFKLNKTPKLSEFDNWILSQLSETIEKATQYFESYEYSKARAISEQFFWNLFCDYYLEIIKDKLYNKENYTEDEIYSAQYTLYSCIVSSLKLLAPIIPFVTEESYQTFFKELDGSKSIHISQWPVPEYFWKESTRNGEVLIDLISKLREYKSQNKISMSTEIEKITITTKTENGKENILSFEKDLKNTMKIKNIEINFSNEIENDFEINVE